MYVQGRTANVPVARSVVFTEAALSPARYGVGLLQVWNGWLVPAAASAKSASSTAAVAQAAACTLIAVLIIASWSSWFGRQHYHVRQHSLLRAGRFHAGVGGSAKTSEGGSCLTEAYGKGSSPAAIDGAVIVLLIQS